MRTSYRIGHVIASMLIGILATNAGWLVAQRYMVGSDVVVVESSSVENYLPIAALGDGWYLVEVTQKYRTRNPFLIGNRITVTIPHLVRMKDSELDSLEKN